MAKATAICTCEKCGNSFEKYATKRNCREAESWEQWAISYYTVCPECEEKETAAKAAAIAESAKANGLPELTGTPKQVVWAEQIRNQIIPPLRHTCDVLKEGFWRDDYKDIASVGENFAEHVDIALANIISKTKSSWWIDKRFDSHFDILKDELASVQKQERQKIPEDVVNEATIIPENQIYGTAKITINDDYVAAKYPKDENFRAVVKECGFRWDADKSHWSIKITKTSGTAVDRAAELANALLRAGFAVLCLDEEVREKAINADFEPRCDRWIMSSTSGEYAGWLSINYPRGEYDLYRAARAIRGAKYSHGSIYVPVVHHDQVEDFSNLYGFKFSSGATQAIADYEAQRLSTVKTAEPAVPEHPDKLAEIMQSSDDILPDLSDD